MRALARAVDDGINFAAQGRRGEVHVAVRLTDPLPIVDIGRVLEQRPDGMAQIRRRIALVAGSDLENDQATGVRGRSRDRIAPAEQPIETLRRGLDIGDLLAHRPGVVDKAQCTAALQGRQRQLRGSTVAGKLQAGRDRTKRRGAGADAAERTISSVQVLSSQEIAAHGVRRSASQ